MTKELIMRRISPEDEEAMVQAYLAGATRARAASQFGVSETTCLKALRRRGIVPRSHAEVCRIPVEHEEGMVEAYLQGYSTIQVAARFGHSQQTCTNVLRRRGIAVRSRDEVCRNYTFDQGFFNVIDTEEKAYWLGFITADGGIVGSELHLTLKIEDYEHIQKFVGALSSNHSVVTIRNGNGLAAHVRISSVWLTKALAQYGVIQNKTFSIQPCSSILDVHMAAYWRGVFDGDGSISRVKYKGEGRYWEVGLVGNQAIVTGFYKFIAASVRSDTVVRPHKKTIFRVRYGGRTLPFKVTSLLYKGATVYLDRKFKLVQQLWEQCGK